MKKSFLILLITGFLLIGIVEIQAQNNAPKLNQIKLMEELWVGNLKETISKDTIITSELIQYGNVFEYNAFLVVKGKQSFSFGGSYVYFPKEDRFKGFAFSPNGNYQTWIGSFTTERKIIMDIVQNFDPLKVLYREIVEWENPSKYTVTSFNLDGKKKGESKWTREKK
jgi:hypothetical protein